MVKKTTIEEDIGLISTERREAVRYAADLETVRINRWRAYRDRNKNLGTLDTSSQSLDLNQLDPGWIYIINNITFIETGSGTPQVFIGFMSEHQHHVLTCQTVGAAENSVEYVGQAVLFEGEYIRAIAESAGSTDKIYLFANGYKIRR